MRVIHKNMLFEFLKKNSPGLNSFELIEMNNRTILRFKGSPLQFIIFPFEHDYDIYSFSSVAYGSTYPLIDYDGHFSFEEVLLHFTEWINENVNPYLEDKTAIDLWEEYRKGGEYLDIQDIQVDDHSFFSSEDRGNLRIAIERIKTILPSEFNVTEAQAVAINAKLDYLVEASNRATKTDWKGIAIGIIASIAIALTLDPERGRQLWELIRNAFSAIQLLPGSGD